MCRSTMASSSAFTSARLSPGNTSSLPAPTPAASAPRSLSIVGYCRLAGVDPIAYLTDVLPKLTLSPDGSAAALAVALARSTRIDNLAKFSSTDVSISGWLVRRIVKEIENA
jgi:hypothetical protein